MIKRAIKEAGRSSFRQQLGAIVVKSGRLLATGYNRVGDNTRLINQNWEGSIHAEQDAILHLLRQGREGELRGATIYVARIKGNGTRLARPCDCCMNLCKYYKIKKVVYTNNDGTCDEVKL